MIKYKAYPKDTKPFVNFSSVNNPAEDDPLVFSEADLPAQEFGVYQFYILDGELVNYTPIEMEAFEAEWNFSEKIRINKSKIDAVENGTFIFDDLTFPLDAASRLFYLSIENQNNLCNIRAVDGTNYLLATANISDFLVEMWKQIQTLTAHTF